MKLNEGILEYLFEKDICVVGEYFKGNKKEGEDVIEHLNIIAEVQKIFMGFNTRSYSGVKSYIGREINRVRIANIILKNIELEEEFNPLVRKMRRVEEELKEINFKKIAKRSVERKEITIGKLDERNIRVLDEIEIGKIKKIAYNVIEEDVISYLKRVKKDSSEAMINKFILEYVKKAGLDVESYKYIKVMLEVPSLCLSYIEKNKSRLDKEKLFELMRREKIM